MRARSGGRSKAQDLILGVLVVIGYIQAQTTIEELHFQTQLVRASHGWLQVLIWLGRVAYHTDGIT